MTISQRAQGGCLIAASLLIAISGSADASNTCATAKRDNGPLSAVSNAIAALFVRETQPHSRGVILSNCLAISTDGSLGTGRQPMDPGHRSRRFTGNRPDQWIAGHRSRRFTGNRPDQWIPGHRSRRFTGNRPAMDPWAQVATVHWEPAGNGSLGTGRDGSLGTGRAAMDPWAQVATVHWEPAGNGSLGTGRDGSLGTGRRQWIPGHRSRRFTGNRP